MREYLSFMVDLEGENFKFHAGLTSHSDTCEAHKLINDKWREAEWIEDEEKSLSVRTHPDDPHDANWLRACILAKWPTRRALEQYVWDNKLGQARNVTATAGYRGTATAGYRGTATAGYRGTATAGYRGTATAGYRGTATAGYRGTATAGYRGTATAGYRGTATAGDRGTATAGYRGTATAGDMGIATAGYRGTATAGDQGVLSFEWYDSKQQKWRRAVAIVGENGIKPKTKYRCDEGRIVEVEQQAAPSTETAQSPA